MACGPSRPVAARARAPASEVLVLRRQLLLARRQVVVVTPPVEANLLGFVDRTHQKADSNRQQLDFRERHLDVTGDDEALVEDAIKDFDQAGGSRVRFDG